MSLEGLTLSLLGSHVSKELTIKNTVDMSLGMMEGPRKGEVVICLVVQELLKCWPIFLIDPVYQRLLHKTGQFNEFVGI